MSPRASDRRGARPILFAAIVSAPLFRTRATAAPSSRAATLLGAIVGGVPEYVTMVVGIKGLCPSVAACYLAVVLTGARGRGPAAMGSPVEDA